jgi:hypothetical protein
MEAEDRVGAYDVQSRRAALLSPESQARHEPAAGKSVGRRYPQRLLAAISLDSGDGCGERFKPVANNRKQTRSSLCQHQRPRPTTEKRLPAISLEQSYLMTDRRRRHAKLVRRLLEAHVPCRCLERAQLNEGRKLRHVLIVDEAHSSAA